MTRDPFRWHPIRRRRFSKAREALRNMPPGYGEHYGYSSHFEPACDEGHCYCENPHRCPWHREPLASMPQDMPEPASVLMAFKQLAACRVCGYRARICSAAACPQRKEEP